MPIFVYKAVEWVFSPQTFPIIKGHTPAWRFKTKSKIPAGA